MCHVTYDNKIYVSLDLIVPTKTQDFKKMSWKCKYWNSLTNGSCDMTCLSWIHCGSKKAQNNFLILVDNEVNLNLIILIL